MKANAQDINKITNLRELRMKRMLLRSQIKSKEDELKHNYQLIAGKIKSAGKIFSYVKFVKNIFKRKT
ncbi:MAG: hypothetical protein H7Y00_07380 [Fimbriimonadaceae bacterium]|nr:hypothetical protein [Chitinophagales bacterium]